MLDAAMRRVVAYAATKQHGPVFLRFVVPTLDTLREFGNSGASAEVTDRVIERCKITAREQDEVTSNGQFATKSRGRDSTW